MIPATNNKLAQVRIITVLYSLVFLFKIYVNFLFSDNFPGTNQQGGKYIVEFIEKLLNLYIGNYNPSNNVNGAGKYLE
jgi:hypothetical protein